MTNLGVCLNSLQIKQTKTFLRYARDALMPPLRLTVSQWADKFRFLSQKSSAEAGKWRTSRTPYLQEIMDELSASSRTQQVVFMKGAQVGGSECGNNWLGYIMHHEPAPMMMILPTLDMARRSSRQRIEPLIESCPELLQVVAPKKQADSSNTLLEKDFKGGTLVITGANSPTGLRQMAARFLFFDEVDAFPLDAGGEGSPIDLAKARARTFSKRKFFMVSTPTIEGRSEISKAFEQSDKRYFHVPCPECNGFQKLEFEHLKFKRDDDGKLIKESVHYLCMHCEYQIQNWQKTKMLARGKWIAEEQGDGKTAGFHLSSLYSPVGWFGWDEICFEFLRTKHSPETLKTFINTVLGLTFKEKSEVPDWRRLYERREQYKIGIVPENVAFLTVGVDVQKDRIEYETVGWCRNKVSYSIEYGVLTGDTSATDVWSQLDAVLHKVYPKENSRNGLPIKMLAIDTGYNTQTVYNWVRKYPATRVMGVKGSDTCSTIIGQPKASDVNIKGKSIKRGLKVWPVGVGVAKSELYGWLRQDAPVGEDTPDPYGYCHFPEYDSEFFKMLTAERLVSKVVKGYTRHEWEKTRDRNESLDTRVYSRAAASVCGLDRFTEENFKLLEQQNVSMLNNNNQNQNVQRKRTRNDDGGFW
jgi:phage terminase large subunit GpA-like protein